MLGLGNIAKSNNNFKPLHSINSFFSLLQNATRQTEILCSRLPVKDCTLQCNVNIHFFPDSDRNITYKHYWCPLKNTGCPIQMRAVSNTIVQMLLISWHQTSTLITSFNRDRKEKSAHWFISSCYCLPTGPQPGLGC